MPKRRTGQRLGTIARRARGILKQGKTLRSPDLLRAWKRLRPQVQTRALRESVAGPVRFVSRATKVTGRFRRPKVEPKAPPKTKRPPTGPRRPTRPRKAPQKAPGRRLEPPREPEEIVEHLLDFIWTHGGKRYRRTLVVPAARGTDDRDLVRQARRELPDGAEKLRRFMTEDNVRVSVGPGTSRGRTAFRR